MKVTTRVMSAWNASACRSNISFAWSRIVRNAERPLERRQLGVVADVLDLLDAALDLAHRLEILVDLRAIGRAKLA